MSAPGNGFPIHISRSLINTFYSIDTKLLQRVSNHPVHILNNEGLFSPSSFIPFCSFGEEFIGAKNEKFNIPICDIFKPKPHFDQLCYEMNLQELKDSTKLENQLKFGLTLVLDYNEERQINFNSMTPEEGHEFTRSIYHKGDDSFSVFVDTISTYIKIVRHLSQKTDQTDSLSS